MAPQRRLRVTTVGDAPIFSLQPSPPWHTPQGTAPRGGELKSRWLGASLSWPPYWVFVAGVNLPVFGSCVSVTPVGSLFTVEGSKGPWLGMLSLEL